MSGRSNGAIVKLGACFAWLAISQLVWAQEIHLKAKHQGAARQPMAPGKLSLRHTVVQFDHPPNTADLDALSASGARVLSAMPDNGVVISSANDLPASLTGSVVWSGALQADEKLSAGLLKLGWNAAVVEFHADVEEADQNRVGADEGIWFTRNPSLRADHALAYGSYSDLAALAAHDEVAYIFPADPALWGNGTFGTRSAVRACAGMLTQNGPVAQYTNIVHGWDLDSDLQAHIRYAFSEMTAKLLPQQIQTEVLRAMADWSKGAAIVFQPATAAASAKTINIRFLSGAHGDSFPFDGPGGVLAHTFYPVPVNSEPIAGDMHLDTDENWHIGGDIDLYSVVVHELGHAIGLSHSDIPGDVMYPYYRTGMKLSANDLGAARQLYGPPQGSSSNSSLPVTTTTTAPLPPTTPTTPTPDSLAPSITVAAGSVPSTQGAVTLSGTLSGGTAPFTITWQTDGNASGRAVLINASSWSAANVPLQAGANAVTVNVLDSLHRSASSTAIWTRALPAVVTAAAPISLTFQSPSAATVVTSSSSLTISGSAAGGSGVTRVSWQTSGGASGTASGLAHWTAAQIPLLVGTNTVVVNAWDSSGASVWRSIVVVRH